MLWYQICIDLVEGFVLFFRLGMVIQVVGSGWYFRLDCGFVGLILGILRLDVFNLYWMYVYVYIFVIFQLNE